MSNVKVFGKETRVNAEAIEVLEKALQEARDGELQEVFVVKTKLNGDHSIDYTATSDVFSRIGRLQHAVVQYSNSLRQV